MARNLTKKQMTEAIHRLVTSLPEARALRVAAQAWALACAEDVRDQYDTKADHANRLLMSAAVDFTNAIRRAAVLGNHNG
jgi:hypothetical protein